jgi:hypothetical protein
MTALKKWHSRSYQGRNVLLLKVTLTEGTARLEKHHYPFDGSWLDWLPDPAWSPPKLPADWNIV